MFAGTSTLYQSLGLSSVLSGSTSRLSCFAATRVLLECAQTRLQSLKAPDGVRPRSRSLEPASVISWTRDHSGMCVRQRDNA